MQTMENPFDSALALNTGDVMVASIGNSKMSLIPAKPVTASRTGLYGEGGGVGLDPYGVTAAAQRQSSVAVKGGICMVLAALVIYKFAVRESAQSEREEYSAVPHTPGRDAEMDIRKPSEGGNMRKRSSLT
jgi:hypothetical protein